MRSLMYSLLLVALLVDAAAPAEAGGTATAARELAETALRKLGLMASLEGTEALTKRIVSAGARYGDDLVEAAVRKVGPRALSLTDDLAGASAQRGASALRLLGRHGDDAAVWVLGRPKAWSLVGKYGDEVGEVLIRHKGVAEPLIEGFGKSGTRALGAVDAQNGRRLGMMMGGGDLARIGRTDELLGVVGRYGDRACAFIWKNKGALTVASTLTAFLAKPEAFLDAAGQTVSTVGGQVLPSAATLTGQITGHVASLLSMVLLGLAALGGLIVFLAAKYPPVRAVLRLLGKRCLQRFNPA